MLTTEMETAIKDLIAKIDKATAGEALHLSQAALNLAHVAATFAERSPASIKPSKTPGSA